ncbi:alpha-N-acetylgalactosaminide alpha-2,6-sialyltransferase 2-like isoform X1 [Asterias rubens]|uniref:alpha-N-acetylgalactosaminide alpha-2,6-sialyltransferase 2-like isoform X1 n=1 Tax=Asterias rubens TaxID=7604 RepID=UPI0014558066|nr:alpha-N-acetylgalactosaminide alpha-2,6-sialyltransferase 2-like isoform X1 [Asterias rubens]XP_033647096.1 alpha-N-acetylgalactosaminide alpha-2,6-sialyltransferase 2-like isoform X1 [Asterias rubens]
MKHTIHVAPRRTRTLLASSQMQHLLRSRKLKILLICLVVGTSLMYFRGMSTTGAIVKPGSSKAACSPQDPSSEMPPSCSKITFLHSPENITKAVTESWGIKDLLQIIRGEDLSNTANFLTFKGARKGEMTFRKNPNFLPSKCPTSLQLKMANDSWTALMYHPEIHMLMNSQLLNQSEHSRLLPYYMPFGYKTKSRFRYKDVFSVLKLFPARDSIFNFTGKQRPQCISCAVVGNGGILNGSRKGSEIDMHHMVFRVNKALRKGHELDVGNRTTHYFFFDRSLRETSESDVPNDQGMIKVFVPCRDNDYKYIRNVVQKKEPKIKADAEDVRILHPDFIRYTHKVWVNSPLGSFRPTTGTIMLFTALHSGCDKVSIYGMGYNDNFTLYYYDQKFRHFKMDKVSHDTKSELKILKGLDRIGAIDWYKRGIYSYFH